MLGSLSPVPRTSSVLVQARSARRGSYPLPTLPDIPQRNQPIWSLVTDPQIARQGPSSIIRHHAGKLIRCDARDWRGVRSGVGRSFANVFASLYPSRAALSTASAPVSPSTYSFIRAPGAVTSPRIVMLLGC
jgi:hypothetical protein